MSQPVLTIDRFLYPSANDTSAEQVQNSSFETDTTGWAVNASGTFVRTTVASKVGSASGLLTKTTASAAGVANMAYAYYRVVPPRGLIVPSTSKIVGPYDTLAAAATIPAAGATTLTVANIDRWPTAGTAILQDALNSPGNLRRREVSWTGKSGSTLTGLLTNIRHEDPTVRTHNIGAALYGTVALRRFLLQAWVFTDTASVQVALSLYPTYVGGVTVYSGNEAIGIYQTLVQGDWTLMEMTFDVTQRNITDPSGAAATGLELRIQQHQLNSINAPVYIDDVKLYHMLELDQRVTDGPTLPVTDRGLIFERTAGGILRAGRVRPDVSAHTLRWGSATSGLTRQNKDRLDSWHADMLYPTNSMHSFDWQHVDPTGGDFRHPQREVVWAQSAVQFQEVGLGPGANYLTEIPLQVVDSETTAL